MKELIIAMPWVAFVCGAVMIGKALRLAETRPGVAGNNRKRGAVLLALALSAPTLS